TVLAGLSLPVASNAARPDLLVVANPALPPTGRRPPPWALFRPAALQMTPLPYADPEAGAVAAYGGQGRAARPGHGQVAARGEGRSPVGLGGPAERRRARLTAALALSAFAGVLVFARRMARR